MSSPRPGRAAPPAFGHSEAGGGAAAGGPYGASAGRCDAYALEGGAAGGGRIVAGAGEAPRPAGGARDGRAGAHGGCHVTRHAPTATSHATSPAVMRVRGGDGEAAPNGGWDATELRMRPRMQLWMGQWWELWNGKGWSSPVLRRQRRRERKIWL